MLYKLKANVTVKELNSGSVPLPSYLIYASTLLITLRAFLWSYLFIYFMFLKIIVLVHERCALNRGNNLLYIREAEKR